MESQKSTASVRSSWNKGKLVGHKAPLKLREIRAIRVRLQLAGRTGQSHFYLFGGEGEIRTRERVVPSPAGVSRFVHRLFRQTRQALSQRSSVQGPVHVGGE